jgi:hypothetical protein
LHIRTTKQHESGLGPTKVPRGNRATEARPPSTQALLQIDLCEVARPDSGNKNIWQVAHGCQAAQALIDSLVADANFEATYTRLNERWMVTKLLSVVESRRRRRRRRRHQDQDRGGRHQGKNPGEEASGLRAVQARHDESDFKRRMIWSSIPAAYSAPPKATRPAETCPRWIDWPIENKYIIRCDCSPTVHRTNYFRQVETTQAMRVFL